MNFTPCVAVADLRRVLTVAAPPAGAEGTFDIPAGAHFNPQKLEKVGEFSATRSRPARFLAPSF